MRAGALHVGFPLEPVWVSFGLVFPVPFFDFSSCADFCARCLYSIGFFFDSEEFHCSVHEGLRRIQPTMHSPLWRCNLTEGVLVVVMG